MPDQESPRKPRLLFVVTEDWYFCSHRLPLARAALAAGFEVSLAARINEHGALIREAGINLVPWNIERGSTGLLSELRAFHSLWKIFRSVRPDLVHQVALKPVLYGSLIARLVRPPAVVNALGGMGSVFTAGSGRKALLRKVVLQAFSWLLSGPRQLLILQNQDDADLVTSQAGVDPTTIRLIRGAGVDVRQFEATPQEPGLPLVVLPARMLWDKGVGEYVEAARQLRAQPPVARFALVGGMDECNPSGISAAQLEQWNAEGAVEWLGMRQDMPAVLREAHIVCLPSYREGLPKALLEAAASARPIVTTDVPGCREVVRHGENGLLVPARDAVALAAALSQLLSCAEMRARMGGVGRSMAVAEFSERRVVEETLKIYSELLPVVLPGPGGRPAAAPPA